MLALQSLWEERKQNRLCRSRCISLLQVDAYPGMRRKQTPGPWHLHVVGIKAFLMFRIDEAHARDDGCQLGLEPLTHERWPVSMKGSYSSVTL